jgi:(1->4)-alpha-D-glucan 1-alpha-D-glucosylmutase
LAEPEAREERFLPSQLPEATYRLQFNASFTFKDACRLVTYLNELGITHCYASPYLKARVGSPHGYDIVDHTTLNPEIGTEQEYDDFVEELRAHGMGQVLDFVPNHMSVASSDNPWWIDVLENGPSSPYANFFDIDWMPLKPDLAHKVLLPVLGNQFGKVLEDGQLVLALEEGGFEVRYGERRFPIAARSWGKILGHRVKVLEQQLGPEHPNVLEYQSILTAISHLPSRTEIDPEKVQTGRREKDVVRRRLSTLCESSSEVKEFIAGNVRQFNGQPGDPRSFDLLDDLLLDQSYRLAYWRVAADEINYRRFFDINELAAICMENPAVFEKAHTLVFRLMQEGKVDGLRIDHPDGLYDPLDYFKRIRSKWSERDSSLVNGDVQQGRPAEPSTSAAHPLSGRPLYLVVEKILEPGERLPEDWPVHGTTGYEFLNALNGLFVDRSNVKAFDAVYSRFARSSMNFKELVYQCKKLIMDVSMCGEVNVLGHQLDRISEQDRRYRDFTVRSLTDAIREVIACFPVYRTYVTEQGVAERDRHYVEQAVNRARRKNPAVSKSLFDFIRSILLLKYPEYADESFKAQQRRFVSRFQQVTGPIMAKAVEDTAFYIYNRLVSLNEVGGDPERFGIGTAAFHQQNLERQARWPHSLLATTTHDTKRSEDVRARINVLSELPREWRAHLFRWSRLNQRHKREVDGEPAPSRNDEYLLYQTLIGTWPLGPMTREEREKYLERIQQYMVKATHEAKVSTSWISPHEAYEQATHDFVEAILGESRRNVFLADFVPFARRIAEYGIWNSLSQTLLKLASPGVPDIYQGAELWDFSLVDPDNRRGVDFAHRQQLLESLKVRDPARRLSTLARELVREPHDGRIKLFLTSRVLNHRRMHAGLYTTGRYLPLEPAGAHKDYVCAFARQTDEHTVLVIAPRLVTRLLASAEQAPTGPGVWLDTWLPFPQHAVGQRFRNVLTGETLVSGAGLPVSSILYSFPVALLEQVPS